MFLDIAADIVQLGLITALAYGLLVVYARHRRPQWTMRLTQRRLAVLATLTLAVSAIKLVEDVVAQESGPVDEAILWLIRRQVPSALNGFFAAVTLSGSAMLLVPLAVIAAGALLVARRRFEAALMCSTMLVATLLVWGMKAIVGRARPALWEAQWYWGSSFPSVHTLSTAAFSTAAALCVARIRPQAGILALAIAMLWTGLVGLSRLVLGVHWPSDVLAALCLGAFVPLLISVAHGLGDRNAASPGPPF